MSKSNSGLKTIICGADTETDHNADGTNYRIVQWSIAEMRDRSADKSGGRKNRAEYQIKHGYTLNEFKAQIEVYLAVKTVKYVIYFHNLTYDSRFFMGYLAELNNRYPESSKIICDESGNPIILGFNNIEFRDSSRKLPAGTTVRDIGEMINLPKLHAPGYNPADDEFKPNWSDSFKYDYGSELDYVDRDALIVGSMMKRLHSLGNTHATISGDAYSDMKATFNRDNYDVLPSGKHKGTFSKHFPTLSFNLDQEIRRAYSGGINYSAHRGRNIATQKTKIIHLDRNSMYPSVMRDELLPYGTPILTTDVTQYKLWLVIGRARLTMKKDMVPILKYSKTADALLEGCKAGDSIVSQQFYHWIAWTNIDIENYERFYNIDWDGNNIPILYGFNAEIGALSPYINKWYKVKQEAPKNSVERLQAKLMLNSVYGRFGMNPDRKAFGFVDDPEIGMSLKAIAPDVADESPSYTPYAVFVTAWARRRLCDAMIMVGPKNVIHMDTDSVVYLGTDEMSKGLGHTDALGDWKIESRPLLMIEGGVKRYIEYETLDTDRMPLAFTCAGLSQKMDENKCPYGNWIEILDNPDRICADGEPVGNREYCVKSEWLRNLLAEHGYNPDKVNTMKLHKQKVKGGMALLETTFTMRDLMRTVIRVN